MDLPYGDEFIAVKVEEISDDYLDVIDDYIGAEIVITGRYVLPVLEKVKKRK